MAFEHLTPLEQQRAREAGEPPPSGYPSWSVYRHEQVLSYREVGPPGGTPLGDGETVTNLVLLTLPYLLGVAAVVVLGGWVVEHGAGYRDLLEAVLPSTWIATEVGGEGRPGAAAGAVGAVVAAIAVAITMVRGRYWRGWVDHGDRWSTLAAGTLALTVARTATVVVGIPLVLGAAGIAAARDLEEGSGTGTGPGALFPYLVALVAVIWLSLGSARRVRHRALARRVALIEALDAQAGGAAF